MALSIAAVRWTPPRLRRALVAGIKAQASQTGASIGTPSAYDAAEHTNPFADSGWLPALPGPLTLLVGPELVKCGWRDRAQPRHQDSRLASRGPSVVCAPPRRL